MSAPSQDAMPPGTTHGTPQILLAHHLKQLKLPTVLREYDKVARECARDGVDHPRYLLRLIELELIDRERRLVERRIRQARFPATKSLDTFEFTDEHVDLGGANELRIDFDVLLPVEVDTRERDLHQLATLWVSPVAMT